MLGNIGGTFQNDSIIHQYLATKSPKWKSLPLPSGIFELLHGACILGPEISSTAPFSTTQNILIGGKPYSTQTARSLGSSYIEYSYCSWKHLGSIKAIVQLPKNSLPTVVVHELLPLDNDDQKKSPYIDMPEALHALVVYDAFGPHHVIQSDHIIGHFVGLHNSEGTFGIAKKTLSAVCLGSWVSLPQIFPTHWKDLG